MAQDFKETIEKLRTYLAPVMDEIKRRDDPFRKVRGKRLEGYLSGYCPVQGEGTVDGLPWYFRARHDSWSFSISEKPEDDPVDVKFGNASGWFYEEDYPGELEDASWMSYEEAQKFIKESVKKYRKNQGFYNSK